MSQERQFEQVKRRRVSIHVIVMLVCVTMLLLPLGSLYFLKLYENALIRQTESELISQAAFISATYKQEVGNQLLRRGNRPEHYGLQIALTQQSNDYFQPVNAKLDLARDRVYPLRPDGKRVKDVPDPVGREAGRHINSILYDAQRTTLSGMKVLNYRGVAVAGKQELGLSFAHLEEVKKAMRGQHVSLLRNRLSGGESPSLSSISRGTNMNVFVTAPIILNGRLVGVALLNRTPIDLMKVLYSKRREIRLAAVLVLLVTLGIAVLTSFAITRPIHALIRQARQITDGNLEAMQPIQQPVTHEIALLSESLSDMAKTIQHRSEYIRNFATSVSHEFKTPLTAIQGSVELLQEHGETMSVPQRHRFLSNISEDTDRLKRLVNRLLELARADMLEPTHARSPLMPIVNALAERYRERGLKVIFADAYLDSSNIKALEVALPSEVLETVLTTLWDNSLQQGASQSQVTLQIYSSVLHMVVSDDGPGISESNRERIFAPFFTTQREKGGTGLGLNITRQLLAAYGASIELTAHMPGASFQISMPLASPTSMAEQPA